MADTPKEHLTRLTFKGMFLLQSCAGTVISNATGGQSMPREVKVGGLGKGWQSQSTFAEDDLRA